MTKNKDLVQEQNLNKTIIEGHEEVTQYLLPKRMPVFIRCDGRAFGSFNVGFKKPYDMVFIKTMHDTGIQVSKQIQGCRLAYTHSDEISFLVIDYDNPNNIPWFNRNLQKIVSVTSGLIAVTFNKYFLMNVKDWWEGLTNEEKILNKEMYEVYNKKFLSAIFDCKAFPIPTIDINRYFIERQKYCQLSFAQTIEQSKRKEYATFLQRGAAIVKSEEGNNWTIDYEVPLFRKEPEYVKRVAKLEGI